MRPANVPRVFSAMPELGWRVEPRTCISYTMVCVEGRPRGGVALPVVRGDVDHDAFRGHPGVVARASRGVAIVGFGDHDASSVGVQENCGGIERHPARRIERAIDPLCVQLAGPHVGHGHVPAVVRAVGRWIEANHAHGLGVVSLIE